MNLEELRLQIELFYQEIRKEYYLQGAGIKDTINLQDIYSKYECLFSDENLSMIKTYISKPDLSQHEKRKSKLLLEALYGEILGYLNKELSEEFLRRESTGKVNLGNGVSLPYRSSFVYMMNESSREKRSNVYEHCNTFKEENLNPLLKRMFDSEYSRINAFGFKNEVDMFQNLSGIDLYYIDRMMQEFLKSTENVYSGLLEKRVKELLNLDLKDVQHHDISYMRRAREYDLLFPKENMIELISDFLERIGIDITTGNNITLDVDAREKKSPRAFCCTVKIPSEVYLVIYPCGGEDDYSAFLHELGHALHYANTAADRDMEFKWFGDNSVTEGYAMTFEYLMMNERWTKNFLGFDSKSNPAYFEDKTLNLLMMLRRFAAKLHYELMLKGTPCLDDKPQLYCKILKDATKINYNKVDYLGDVDSYFYCARYLRAWMLQSLIHHGFKDRFGEDWFLKPDSGQLLKELWSFGQKYDAEEIAEINGLGKLSTECILEDINKILYN
jgi:hypothetical protein